MPSIFKALTSITVWILFITGCLVLLVAIPLPFLNHGGNWPQLAVGIASLVLAVIVIKLRKTL